MENSVKNRLLLVGERIVASDAEGRLVALARGTGRIAWRHELPYHYVVMNSAPAATPDGKAVVHGLVRWMAAVDVATGKEMWKVFNHASEGVPQRFAVDGERLYGISNWDGIYPYWY